MENVRCRLQGDNCHSLCLFEYENWIIISTEKSQNIQKERRLRSSIGNWGESRTQNAKTQFCGSNTFLNLSLVWFWFQSFWPIFVVNQISPLNEDVSLISTFERCRKVLKSANDISLNQLWICTFYYWKFKHVSLHLML